MQAWRPNSTFILHMDIHIAYGYFSFILFKKTLKSNILFLGQLKKTYIMSHLKKCTPCIFSAPKECQNHSCWYQKFSIFEVEFFLRSYFYEDNRKFI